MIVFLLALLNLVQSGAVSDYPDDRVFCYTALVLAKHCQYPERLCYEEGTVHKIEHLLRVQGKQLGPGFQLLLSISEERYIKYLGRIRELIINRKSMGRLVQGITRNSVREYLPTFTEVDAFRYEPVAGILRSIDFFSPTRENVRLEYIKSAVAALNTYASVHHDYQAYSRFPDMSKPFYLGVLEDFVGKSFADFDFGATYPDIVMCLSILQFLEYRALIDNRLDHVDYVSKIYDRAMKAIGTMNIIPVSAFDYKRKKGQVTVAIMQQAKKGPNPVPINIIPFENGSLVQISILDVEDPEDIDLVLDQVKHLDVFAKILN